jgi:hypothetical protein
MFWNPSLLATFFWGSLIDIVAGTENEDVMFKLERAF